MSEVLARRMDGISDRLREAERDQAVTHQIVVGLEKDMHELRDEFRSVKRALYGLAFSVAGGAAVFSFTVFTIWGST